jgi:uncharacterized membrane protein YfcA
MPTETVVILAALILVVGFLYSSVGHAGASGYLAVMAIMGVAPGVMKPTALVLNILVATIGTIQFWRAGHFDWRLFWPFAVGSIPLAWLGGRIQLPPEVYKTFIGVVLLFSAWRLVVIAGRKTETPATMPPLGVAIGAGAALGFLAGLSGTGGGIFLSPLLLLLNWADAKRTAAVSAMFILVNSISGIAGYWHDKHEVPMPPAAWLAAAAVGGLAGSYAGARRFDPRMIRRMLAVVLVIAGGKLTWEGVEKLVRPAEKAGGQPAEKAGSLRSSALKVGL